MDLYFFTEERFLRYNGVVYSHAGFADALWKRYLQKFDHVFVVGRLMDTPAKPLNLDANTLKDVRFVGLPYYVGPIQYFFKSRQISARLNEIIKPGNAFLCRVPGTIGHAAIKALKSKNIPYAVEVVGDPEESLSPTALNGNLLAPVYRNKGIKNLKSDVRGAKAALYVTNEILQKKYPVAKGVFETGASNVILKDEYYRSEVPHIRTDIANTDVRLLSVGTLAQLYKAPDVVLKALKEIKDRGIKFHLNWCGGGMFQLPMKNLADKLGVGDIVTFMGQVTMEQVRDQMRNADILVHASRAEGLPRAVIEAMAFGLPCIGTTVAGIPELLLPEALIPSDNVEALADKLFEFINDPDKLQRNAIHNYEESKKYHVDILNERRLRFFDEIIRISQSNGR